MLAVSPKQGRFLGPQLSWVSESLEARWGHVANPHQQKQVSYASLPVPGGKEKALFSFLPTWLEAKDSQMVKL